MNVNTAFIIGLFICVASSIGFKILTTIRLDKIEKQLEKIKELK